MAVILRRATYFPDNLCRLVIRQSIQGVPRPYDGFIFVILCRDVLKSQFIVPFALYCIWSELYDLLSMFGWVSSATESYVLYKADELMKI